MSDFMKTVTEKLKTRNLTQSSITTYLRNLTKLNEGQEFKNFKFLSNCEETIKKMANLSDNTKKAYLISICSVLKLFTDDKKIEKLYKCYFEEMKKKRDELKKIPSNKLSNVQKDNWVNYNDMIKKNDELKEIVHQFSKNKTINETQYQYLLSYMILSLYILGLPRRNKDYLLMNVVKKWNSNMDDKFNYLDLDNKQFIFNQFKTKKSEGQQIMKFSDELNDVIHTYLKFRLKDKINSKLDVPFLVKYNGDELRKNINSITLVLNKIFKPKKISSSMIRHARNTEKLAPLLEQIKEDAHAMAHSEQMAMDYIKDISVLQNH